MWCSDDESALNEVNIMAVSRWLLCMYKSMDEFAENDATLAELRALKMLPLAHGRCVTSVAQDTVFFPVTSSAVDKRGLYALIIMIMI